MHNPFHTGTLLPAMLLALASLTGCRTYDTPSADNAVPQAANISVADLHSLCRRGPVKIDEPLVAGGYVTSSDRASNFYRTFTIEDPTGGMEIMAGLYDLHNIYPEGYYITVALKGCVAAESYGVLQAGTEQQPYDRYPAGYFPSRAVLDRHVRRYDIRHLTAPMPLTAGELTATLCGRLVTVGPLHLTTGSGHGDAWNASSDGTWSGYNFFAADNGDDDGVTVAVYTSAYASYAGRMVPEGRVTITGILQFGKADGEDMFMIKMRDENDCTPYN